MLAGIDTHKDTLAVAVIDAAGRAVATVEVPNTEIASRLCSPLTR